MVMIMNCYHLFHHCKEKKYIVNEPVFTSSFKRCGLTVMFSLTASTQTAEMGPFAISK